MEMGSVFLELALNLVKIIISPEEQCLPEQLRPQTEA